MPCRPSPQAAEPDAPKAEPVEGSARRTIRPPIKALEEIGVTLTKDAAGSVVAVNCGRRPARSRTRTAAPRGLSLPRHAEPREVRSSPTRGSEILKDLPPITRLGLRRCSKMTDAAFANLQYTPQAAGARASLHVHLHARGSMKSPSSRSFSARPPRLQLHHRRRAREARKPPGSQGHRSFLRDHGRRDQVADDAQEPADPRSRGRAARRLGDGIRRPDAGADEAQPDADPRQLDGFKQLKGLTKPT